MLRGGVSAEEGMLKADVGELTSMARGIGDAGLGAQRLISRGLSLKSLPRTTQGYPKGTGGCYACSSDCESFDL